MEVDQSIRTNQVNYGNRPQQPNPSKRPRLFNTVTGKYEDPPVESENDERADYCPLEDEEYYPEESSTYQRYMRQVENQECDLPEEDMEDSRPVPPFRCNQIETGKLAKEWGSWKESLGCYFAAYGITDQQVMKAKPLQLGGPALQTVFKNLKDRDHMPVVSLMPKWYDAAVDKLDEFFEPRHQTTSERRKLRQLKQKSGERFADFITRLKQQVSECGFEHYGGDIEEILTEIYLTDAVVEGSILTRKQVRTVEDQKPNQSDGSNKEETEQDKVYYAFYSGNESNVVTCNIGGVDVDMLIDSGADANLISNVAWLNLKEKRVKLISSTKVCTRIFKTYGSNDPLKILGTFVAEIGVSKRTIRAEFLVVEGGQRCLLGDTTAKCLGILKVGLNINQVDNEPQPFSIIKGVKAFIHIDPDMAPVFQPMRRLPLPLKEAVNKKLDELLRRDIIEPKTGPITWVSPLVVVGKANGEVRLCLDLRRVNEAVLREHHPMPVVDDHIARLGKGTIWSKLDIKEAF
ncbi:uncharacterized protein LOC129728457 [Wyeomyia smithii]|uniref:uncharacterized protein LOC129728457 n=1 Tax=Wyeomyia smithii TaxID=174621 RepID=UPI002468015B|nr:uncharacterized protein LOC129728457 [Wyeomyia smithii]